MVLSLWCLAYGYDLGWHSHPPPPLQPVWACQWKPIACFEGGLKAGE